MSELELEPSQKPPSPECAHHQLVPARRQPFSQLPPSKNASSSDFRSPIFSSLHSNNRLVLLVSIPPVYLPSSILCPRRSTLANQHSMSPVKMTDTTGAKRKRGLGSSEKGNRNGPGIPPKRGRPSVEPAAQDGESAIIKTEPDLDAASESKTEPGSKPANEEQDVENLGEQVDLVKGSPSASPSPVKEEEEDKQRSSEQNVDPVCATSLPSETTSTKASVEREATVGKTTVGKTPVGTPGKAPASPRHTHRDEDIATGKKSPRVDTPEGVDITTQTAPSANDGAAPMTLARPSVAPAGASALPALAAPALRRARRPRKRKAAPLSPSGPSAPSAPPVRPSATPARPSAPPAPPSPLPAPPTPPVGSNSRSRRSLQRREAFMAARAASAGVPSPRAPPQAAPPPAVAPAPRAPPRVAPRPGSPLALPSPLSLVRYPPPSSRARAVLADPPLALPPPPHVPPLPPHGQRQLAGKTYSEELTTSSSRCTRSSQGPTSLWAQSGGVPTRWRLKTSACCASG